MESLDVPPTLVVDTFQFSGSGHLFVEILLDRVELFQSAMVIFALAVECIEQGLQLGQFSVFPTITCFESQELVSKHYNLDDIRVLPHRMRDVIELW
jgi:hypothetical protein